MKPVLLLIVVLLTWSNFLDLPALAKNCYDFQEHTICIINIERSAKYYWQYKVDLSIDEDKQQRTIYDCRQQTKRVKNRDFISFKSGDVGYFICSLFQ